MRIECLPVGVLQANCYIVICEDTRRAMVIDPGDEGERIVATLDSLGVNCDCIVMTHGHPDHTGAYVHVREATSARVAIGSDDSGMLPLRPDILLEDGEVLKVGRVCLEVIHTPGHTPGGICLHSDGVLFSGDTLFARGIGRTDLPGGCYEALERSIEERIFSLPDETRVYPGHGPSTTIGREKEWWES